MRNICLSLLLIFSLESKSEALRKDSFIPLSNIHPTQAYVGHYQIPEKIEKILKEYKKNKLKKYLKEKWSPAIIGPNKKYWIIDRHHLSFAL